MSSANFRGMRTRRSFLPGCGRTTRWALLPGLAALTVALGLVVAAPPVAASTQTQHFTVEMFWGADQPSSSVPDEVLGAFSFSPSPQGGLPSSERTGSVTATMPVNDESASLLLAEFLTKAQEKDVCVAFYPAARMVTTKPIVFYWFREVLITSYLFQAKPGPAHRCRLRSAISHFWLTILRRGRRRPPFCQALSRAWNLYERAHDLVTGELSVPSS